MSATWTQEAILQGQEAQKAFITNGEFIGALLAFGCLIPLAIHDLLKKDISHTMIWPAIFFALMFASQPVAILLTYFSPPAWLTLGHQIGGFMPTSCEVSKPIEGPNSWPCQAFYFKWWLAGVAGPDGWLFLVNPHPLWVAYLLVFFVELLVVGLLCCVPYFDRIMERQVQERREQEREQQRKWGIKSGIDGGYGESRTAESYTDEKTRL